MANALRWLCVSTLVIATACATWRPATPGDLERPDLPNRALVVTEERGLEIEEMRSNEKGVSGRLVRAWKLPGAQTKFDATLIGESDWPGTVADKLRWVPEPLDGEPGVQVDRGDIRLVRVYEARVGRSVAATVGAIGAVVVVVGGILFLSFVSSLH